MYLNAVAKKDIPEFGAWKLDLKGFWRVRVKNRGSTGVSGRGGWRGRILLIRRLRGHGRV